MGKNTRKFLLLTWKNWMLLKRRPVLFAIELIFPILIILLILAIRISAKVKDYPENDYKSLEELSACQVKNLNKTIVLMGYSPKNNPLENLLTNLSGEMGRLNITTAAVGFKDKKELEDQLSVNYSFVFGIQLDDSLSGQSEIPANLKLTFRFRSDKNDGEERDPWRTSDLFPLVRSNGPREGDDPGCDLEPDYYKRGFIIIQSLVAYKILEFQGKSTSSLPKLSLKRFPNPAYGFDSFLNTGMVRFLPFLMTFMFMFSCINTIQGIATEKEQQLKESMKIMGLPGWLHWTAWFIRSFVILLIATIGIVMIMMIKLAANPLVKHSNGLIIFVFLAIYGCSVITFCFLVSAFFSKAIIATAVGSILYVVQGLPFTILVLTKDYKSLSLATKLGTSLLSNGGMSLGMFLVFRSEASEEGIHWGNLFAPVSPDDDISVGTIMLYVLLDTVIYLILALYIEAVFPGDFGMPQKWYFPVSKSYWCPSRAEIESDDLESSVNVGKNFEMVTNPPPAGVKIINLKKTFGSNTVVKNLNLEMYEGHITVLLGHNGAGKTTTMNMITGMFPPTEGTAIVNGYDVRKNVGKVRDSLGLCLQHNVLFERLTVREHLYFFGKLKGLPENELQQEIKSYISELDLENKKNSQSRNLSGGMKRKVCVGIALCGGSKVIMLDEPTAGMDPTARRVIWDLLLKRKEGRTILLTTHYMDEADLLGDRIAIMSAGELQCSGSSFFLKKVYGTGYYLVMDIDARCDIQQVTQLLRQSIPQIKVHSQIGSELKYLLPEHESAKFEAMLSNLERSMANLRVNNYGISVATLEEVFMKAGADRVEVLRKQNTSRTQATSLNSDYYEGCPLIRNQIYATLLKKLLSSINAWPILLLQIIVPVALVILGIIFGRGQSTANEFPALSMTLDVYSNTRTVIETNNQSNPYFVSYKGLPPNEPEVVSNFSAVILNHTVKEPAAVKNKYVVGAAFEDDSVTARFNTDPYHSPGIANALMLNAFYKVLMGADHSIKFINHPLPVSKTTQAKADKASMSSIAQVGALAVIGMALVAGFYILFYIRERVCKLKHLQLVSGINISTFWITNFICDFLIYMVTVAAILIVIAAFHEEGMKTSPEIGRITVVLVLFGLAILPLVYLGSFFFDVPAQGFLAVFVVGYFFGGMLPGMLEMAAEAAASTAELLKTIMLIVPFYAFTKSFSDLAAMNMNVKSCKHLTELVGSSRACDYYSACCDFDGNYFSLKPPGIGKMVLISLLTAAIFFISVLMIDYGMCLVFKRMAGRSLPPVKTDLDNDVANENRKIRESPLPSLQTENILLVKDLTKFYRGFLAVNRICLGVKKSECFGLLGINGAGKTTTFKMLTGDDTISYGDAWIDGYSVKSEQSEAMKLIGYCPQFDALLDDLTVRQTLKIFALIRGVPNDECRTLGETLAIDYDFYKHLDKKVKQLSGGNKRKLSTALALIGDPPLIFLDEPSAGMDPATKHYLWLALCKLRDSGKCIILTSHSMEECEALCTRLAIMVRGTFQCLGSTQRLKSKFAQGSNLTIKMRKIGGKVIENDVTAVERFVVKQFPSTVLRERHGELLSFHIADTSVPWSRMFGIMEKNKKAFNIEDYSLGQCSLEQVFLSFSDQKR